MRGNFTIRMRYKRFWTGNTEIVREETVCGFLWTAKMLCAEMVKEAHATRSHEPQSWFVGEIVMPNGKKMRYDLLLNEWYKWKY